MFKHTLKLNKRTYRWLLISGLLAALGWMADRQSRSAALPARYASQLSDYCRQQTQETAPLLTDTSLWRKIYDNTQGPYALPNAAEMDLLQRWSQEPVVWMLFRDSISIFWTDNTLIIPDTLLRELYRSDQTRGAQLNTGFYVLNSRSFKAGSADLLLLSAIPVKYTYPAEGPFLKERFAAAVGSLPNELIVGHRGEKAVLGPAGETLFYLSADERLVDDRWHLPALLLFLAACLLFVPALNDLANSTARQFHPWLGIGLLLGGVLLLKLFLKWWGFMRTFSDVPLLRDLSGPFMFGQSLGDCVLGSLILFWLAVFFHRESRLQVPAGINRPWPFLLTTALYSSVVISLLMMIWLFQRLVLESGLVLDLETLFGFDFDTLLALLTILIITLSVFLFNHRVLQATSSLQIRLPVRLWSALGAILISYPVFYAFRLGVAPFPVLIMAIAYVLGLSYTVRRPSMNLTLAVGWLLFFAVCSSLAVHHYRQQQGQATRKAYARILCDPQDLVLEEAIERLSAAWSVAGFPQSTPTRSDTFPIPPAAIVSSIQAGFSTEPYLFQHYEFQLFGINRQNGRPLIDGQLPGAGMRLLALRNTAVPATVDNLYYWPEPNQQDFSYLLDLAPADTNRYFLLVLRHRSQKEQRVYDELLPAIPYKRLPQLPLYDYILYGGPRTLKQSGKLPSGFSPAPATIEAGQFQEIDEAERPILIYKSERDFTVLLSRGPEGDLQWLSLFSFLFSALVVLLILLSVLNYFWRALPHAFEFSSFQRVSLRNRIQRAVLLLIVGSFVLVGIFTAGFFRRNALRAGSEQLNEKVQAVRADLQRNIAGREDTVDNLPYLAPLIEPIADIHNMDINIYDLQGQLQLSSADFLFQQQIAAPLMNPIALQALRLPTQSTYRTEERIGDLVYQSAYEPLRDPNEEIIAYLELPYYTNARGLRSDLQSFFSALLNVYVFLLLFAGAIALSVAKSITRPISQIGEKLSHFRLGHNEPLEWKSPDEIGRLIAEYNRMIRKLEESAEKLRQSEREGAWREMAKQVAHEIKNPLTPMKLNIQHLLRIQEQDPERAGQMLSEVARSLIQQIDGLSRIAEEFSNFAKMPQAQNETFILNELLDSVYNLYAKVAEGSTELHLDLPGEQLAVFADPYQLTRVINNLIENALHAIPDGRKGQVSVKLERQGQNALLRVADNGSGIPESLRERVFFPNFTTRNSGMGLGLAISRSIVHAASGSIYFETQENQGTTFYVQLPLDTNKAEA